MDGKIRTLKGTKKGPISLVLGGVHGNELCGIEAIKALATMRIDAGEVMYGIANPRAVEQNVRFIESNLNRMFKPLNEVTEDEKQTYEYLRAQELKPFMNKAEALLDIHASYTPNSQPFLICEPNSLEIAGQLPINRLVSGFGHVEKGGTDGYMADAGKLGLCAECGFKDDLKSHEQALKTLKAFLVARGHIPGRISKPKQHYFHMEKIYITRRNFTPTKAFDDFEVVPRNGVIGSDGSEVIRVKKETVVLFVRSRKHSGEEAFVSGFKSAKFI